jgi:hypothetical protein
MGKVSFRGLDFGSEKSTAAFKIRDPETDGSDYTAFLAGLGQISGTDLPAITIYEEVWPRVVSVIDLPYGVKATNPFAQRENKWLVRMQDTGGNRESFTIPMPDNSLLQPGSEFADLTAAVWVAFIARLEDYYRSKAGLTASVVNVQFVARDI